MSIGLQCVLVGCNQVMQTSMTVWTMHAIDHALDHVHWMDEKNVMTVVSMPLLMSQGYTVVKMSLSGKMIQ